MAVTIPSILRIRRGTNQEWRNANPVLMEGEMGLVTDGEEAGRIKVGDGVTSWNSLEFTIGAQGDTGPVAQMTVAATNTTNPGVNASVTVNNNALTFNIPRGAPGPTGPSGPIGPPGEGFVNASNGLVRVGSDIRQHTLRASTTDYPVGTTIIVQGFPGTNTPAVWDSAIPRVNTQGVFTFSANNAAALTGVWRVVGVYSYHLCALMSFSSPTATTHQLRLIALRRTGAS